MSKANETTPAANPNKALWEKGDFTRIADKLRASGESFVRRLGVQPDHHVLDLGCGDGTTAIPAAQLGATVRGIDIARHLVDAGNARAAALDVTSCTFEVGDAPNLEAVEDATFELLISVFGAMFAPRPHDTAAEMVRVAKPGGRIVMGNWIPGDPTLVAQILRISGSCAAAPRRLRQPRHLGARGPRPRSLHRGWHPRRPHPLRARHLGVGLRRHPGGVR